MSYDTSANRELAKTALAIYQRHTLKESAHPNSSSRVLTESNNYVQQRRTPTTIREAVEDVLMEYASDVVLTSEINLGRKLNENEINNVAGRLLEYINILPQNQQVTLMKELSSIYEAHGHGHMKNEEMYGGRMRKEEHGRGHMKNEEMYGGRMRKEEHGRGKKIYEDTPVPPAEDFTSDSGYIYPAAGAPTGGGLVQGNLMKPGADFDANTFINPATGLPTMEPFPYNQMQGVGAPAAIGNVRNPYGGRAGRLGVPGRLGTENRRKRRG